MSISYDSELRQLVTAQLFEKSYSQFIEQADCNAISKKSEGPRIPYGFTIKKIDGGNWSQHFGQGAASKTPYINWHVVSVYYMPDVLLLLNGTSDLKTKEIMPYAWETT